MVVGFSKNQEPAIGGLSVGIGVCELIAVEKLMVIAALGRTSVAPGLGVTDATTTGALEVLESLDANVALDWP
jgi:hypothetical protein